MHIYWTSPSWFKIALAASTKSAWTTPAKELSIITDMDRYGKLWHRKRRRRNLQRHPQMRNGKFTKAANVQWQVFLSSSKLGTTLPRRYMHRTKRRTLRLTQRRQHRLLTPQRHTRRRLLEHSPSSIRNSRTITKTIRNSNPKITKNR
jgi:hypothetical protein